VDSIVIRRIWKTALLVGAGLAMCAGPNAYAQLVAPPTPNAACVGENLGNGVIGPCVSPQPLQPRVQSPAAQNPMTNAAGNAAYGAGAAIGGALVNGLLAPAPPPQPLVVPRAPDAGPQGIQLDQLQQRSDADWQRQQEDARIRQQAELTRQQTAALSELCHWQATVSADRTQLNNSGGQNPIPLQEDETKLNMAKQLWSNISGGSPFPQCINMRNFPETTNGQSDQYRLDSNKAAPNPGNQKASLNHSPNEFDDSRKLTGPLVMGNFQVSYYGSVRILTKSGQILAGQAMSNYKLGDGDTILTGPDSGAEVTFPGREIIRLAPNSNFEFERDGNGNFEPPAINTVRG
jgi:hypothetical protein